MKPSQIATLLVCVFSVPALAQWPGEALFKSDQIHEVRFTFTQPGYWDSLTTYKQQGDISGNYKFLESTVQVNGEVYSPVGVRLKGNSSYGHPGQKKPFKIDFDYYNPALHCDGLKKLNLNNSFKDPTFLREKIALDFCWENGIYAPRCTYANVYINDIFWGFYTLVEQLDKTFLETRFGNDYGNLFKGDPNGLLRWQGPSESAYYNNYELHTNELLNWWGDLVELIDKVNNTPPAAFPDSLETLLYSGSRIKAWAVENVFANLDSYLGSGHNYYIYHSTFDDRFYWIAWDVNEAFGNFNMGMNITQLQNLSIQWMPPPPAERPLTLKMLQDPAYKQAYVNTICGWLGGPFTTTALYPKMDSLADHIRSHVYADPNKMFTNADFDFNISNNMGNIPGLKPFVANRWNSLAAEVSAMGCTPGFPETTREERLLIYPNPTNGEARITSYELRGEKLEVLDVYGRTVKTLVPPTSEFILDLTHSPTGVYFILLQAGDRQLSAKVVKY